MRHYLPFYWTLRTRIGRRPSLFGAAYRMVNQDTSRLVGSDTSLVIDGFPRSGNSFTVYAVLRSANRDITIAHHLHASGQLLRAARWGIPACVVIRDPIEAIPAFLAKNPRFGLADALAAYALYYRELFPLRREVVVARFETLTTDIGLIIEGLNRRFGLGLTVPDVAMHAQLTTEFLNQERFLAEQEGIPLPPPAAPADMSRESRRWDACIEIHHAFTRIAREAGL